MGNQQKEKCNTEELNQRDIIFLKDPNGKRIFMWREGFGTVYRGIYKNQIDVAIKKVHFTDHFPEFGTGKETAQLANQFYEKYLEKEYSMLMKLDHRNVVKCLGYFRDGEKKNSLNIVLKYVDGGSLFQFLKDIREKRRRDLSIKEKIQIIYDVARGVNVLHKKGIINRNLSTMNILIKENGKKKMRAVVCDFGGANDLKTVKTQKRIEKPFFTATEILNDESIKFSKKSDLFSFGVVMWCILTNQEPSMEISPFSYQPKFENQILNDLMKICLKYCSKFEQRPESLDMEDFKKFLPKYWVKNGLKNISKKKFEKAILCYFRAIKIDPLCKHAYNNIGLAYSYMYDYKKAELYYRKTIEIDDKYSKAYYNLGNMYFILKDFKSSKKFFKRAIELKPDYEKALNGLGLVYSFKENFSKAITVYEKVISINPTKVKTLINLSNLWIKKQKFESAIECYQKAKKFCTREFEESLENLKLKIYKTLVNHGIMLKDHNKAIESMNIFLKAIEIDENQYIAHFHLGLVFLIIKRFENALDSFKKVVEINNEEDLSKLFLYESRMSENDLSNDFEEILKKV